jgi:hypothetical protein
MRGVFWPSLPFSEKWWAFCYLGTLGWWRVRIQGPECSRICLLSRVPFILVQEKVREILEGEFRCVEILWI